MGKLMWEISMARSVDTGSGNIFPINTPTAMHKATKTVR